MEEQIYKDYMHYGEILFCRDFEFKNEGFIITMKVAILDGVKRLFYCRDGKLIKIEILENK